MARRIIVCDGAETARLWSRIGAADNEELTWVPREDEARARPPGCRSLPGGLCLDAFARIDPKVGDGFALATDDGPWLRTAVPLIAEVAPEAPILVLTDVLGEDDLPDHPCLRPTGLKTLIRDDIDEEFDHLANLQRVVELRALLDPREKVGILLQPDPDPDGIACGFALRAILGRKRPTAPLISFGPVQRPENKALVQALGLEVRVITPDELDEFDGLALVDEIRGSLDGRIDDPEGGWKARGLWMANGDRTPWLIEGGAGTKPLVAHFQLRPDPLAK